MAKQLTKGLQYYVGGVVVVGVLSAGMLDWASLAEFPRRALGGLALLTVLGIASEVFAVNQKREGAPSGVSLTFLPLIAACLIFGPVGAVAFVGISIAVTETIVRRKTPVKAAFNVAQAVVAASIAGFFFEELGGYPVSLADTAVDYRTLLIPGAVFGFIALVVNHLIVTGVLAISEPDRRGEILSTAFSRVGGTIVYDLLVLPIGLLVAVLWEAMDLLGIVVAMLPLLFIRHAYGAKYRVEAANRDLLDALVTAIETRDPYTSGHARRVQDLSVRIGRKMRLSPNRIDELKASALLHDIGKIEVRYEDVLKKPGALTDEERALIQSHVPRGVEILESLSSVSSRVIEGVRDHHERIDGKGYPNGKTGSDISEFGKIINIADAVDAMLSDRPYRKALSLEKVRKELERCAGTQFDEDIVPLVVDGEVLEDHYNGIRLRGLGRRENLHEPVVGEPQW